MKHRHPAEYIKRRLLDRSAVNEATPLIAGRHCREWYRAAHNLGYGRLTDGARVQYTHRLSFEVFRGPIPAGLDVLHKCDNPKCIEPEHLWAGTHQENLADMVAKGRHLAGRARGAAKTRGLPSKSRGEKHGLAKLTEDQAREIKGRLTAHRRVKVMPIAREFGVSESLVRGIRDGRNWGWL